MEDDFPEHPKVEGLSDAAFRLWVSAIAYSNRHQTDGRITKHRIKKLSLRTRYPLAAFSALARGGLAHSSRYARCTSPFCPCALGAEPGDDYIIHNFFKYQPKAEKKAAISEARAEAGRRGAAARWGKEPESDGKLPSWQNAPDPTRPDPTRTTSVLKDVAGSVNQISDLEALVKNQGWVTHLGAEHRARAERIIAGHPIEQAELSYALGKISNRTGEKAVGWLLGVIEGQRDRAAVEASKPKPHLPARRVPKHLDRDRWTAIRAITYEDGNEDMSLEDAELIYEQRMKNP